MTYLKLEGKTYYYPKLRVIYPHRCSQCGSRNIEDDAHFLYHLKSHGIRNLYSHWDKRELEK